MWAVYETLTGRLVSVGSIVASPLPGYLTARDLGADSRLLTGYGRWDAVTRGILPDLPPPMPLSTADRLLLTTLRGGRP